MSFTFFAYAVCSSRFITQTTREYVHVFIAQTTCEYVLHGFIAQVTSEKILHIFIYVGPRIPDMYP